MQTCAKTVTFDGVEARLVEAQCALSAGLPAFHIVGLPDKAISEARERIRSALSALSIALPAKRITINLSPADLPKEGSHFDLPIALALLAALDLVPPDELSRTLSLGELALDGRLAPVSGALPAAVTAASLGLSLICPSASGPEAAWVTATEVFAPSALIEAIRHLTGAAPIAPAQTGELEQIAQGLDLAQVRGQEMGRRAIEIAAAGRHHILLTGAPGSGKSLLAACLPSLLPPLTVQEALETSMIHSVAGMIRDGKLSRTPPFRSPHHTISRTALIGGGTRANPGEVSLAHNGVLFLDELPEFARSTLETLRQPIETQEVLIARANAHTRYPCRFMLVAAANPCRCGYIAEPERCCSKAPLCSEDYLSRISGPLMDRFDLRIEAPPVQWDEIGGAATGESSAIVAERVARAQAIQRKRYANHANIWLNSDVTGEILEEIITLDGSSRDFLKRYSEKWGLTMRGYHRILRVARTIADLEASESVSLPHLAEAAGYRTSLGQRRAT